MLSTFVQHELKAFWRSKNSGKTLAVRIFMAILILYLLLNVLVVAFFLDKIISEVFPDTDMIPSFNGILLYYFLFDLLMRLQLQELPTLRVQPYLHLPIKRNTIVGYLSATSLFSVFNLWPVLMFSPFIIKIIGHDYRGGTAVIFIAAILLLTIYNNYLALYIKRKANLNGWIFLGAIAVLVLITSADFVWHLYSVRNISALFFNGLLTHPLLILLPAILAGLMYLLNTAYLKSNLYLEELGSRKAVKYKSSTDIPLLGYFGRTGDLVANEVKLIIRNKRSRSSFIMSLVFLFYGLIFYTNPVYAHRDGMKVFCGMFMTGVFIINYGQFMFSWQAAHFDGLLVSKINFKDFFKAKFLMFSMVSLLAFTFTLPYAYFGWHVIFIHFMMCLWNIGVNTTILLFFANRNYRRIDLSKGASFNWEGVNFKQILVSFMLMGAAFVIYGPLSLFGKGDMALLIMGAIGLIMIFTRGYWIKQLTADFYEKKYTIAEGFREK